jgi:hypothetical protein
MPHKFFRACDETTFMDGKPEQSEDDVYESFYETHGHYPSQIFSVDENNDNTPVWENDEEEDL